MPTTLASGPLVRALLALWLALLLALAGAPAAPAAPDPRAGAYAAPALAQEKVDRQRQATSVQRAFDLLMDRFVRPLDSAALLNAAWEQVAQDALEQAAPPPGPAPALTGDRARDIAAFRAALAAYQGTQPTWPAGFVPAYSAIRGMVGFANEGHTYFMDPGQYQEHLAWSRGDVKYGGIGARMKGPDLMVTEVFAGSPAERAGLRAGDLILRVDGQPVAGLSVEQAVSLIRGPEGSSVELVVERPGEAAPLTLSIVRAEIAYDFVAYRTLGNTVGYVQLRGFPDPAVADQFEQDLAILQEQGAKGLILDLRGNPGGRLDVGSRLLSLFLPPGTALYEQVERDGREESRAQLGAALYSFPVVVLVDGGTASMGEIFAAAMQEARVATVIGTVTSGNVAAAQVFPLGDGSALQVTVMEIRSGQGSVLNGVGVVPDEIVEPEPADVLLGRDPVLDRAREVLQAVLAPAPRVSAGRFFAE